MARKGSAAVSSVLRPAPTTNMLPHNPPKDRLTPESQRSRLPIARIARPVMNVTLKPKRRRIQPDIVSGQTKYAPNYEEESPAAREAVMFRVD